EMVRHISDALEQSPVLSDNQAPLIDPEHLDHPPDLEAQEEATYAPEPEEEPFEAVAFTAPDKSESPAIKDEDKGKAKTGSGNYLADELKIYQRDKAVPAKRQAHLLCDAEGQNQRPGAAALATACEGQVGGLARALPGMQGDFVGLSG